MLVQHVLVSLWGARCWYFSGSRFLLLTMRLVNSRRKRHRVYDVWPS